MTQASSNTIFVVENRLPWPDDSSALGEKGEFESRRADRFRRSHAMLDPQDFGARRDARHRPENRRRERGHAGTRQWAAPGRNGRLGRPARIGHPFQRAAGRPRADQPTLVSQPVERRSMPRVELRCAVHIKYAEHYQPATMRNISARGLQIEGEGLPPRRNLYRAVRRGAEHSAGRSRMEPRQSRRDRGVRGTELDLDHPLGARDHPQQRKLTAER